MLNLERLLILSSINKKLPYITTYPQSYTHDIHKLKSTCYFKAFSKAAISSLEKREYAI